MISTKAGYDMWPGPYGQGGGSRKYVLSSLDQSLARMGLDYVDIFYSHRFDPETPVEETMMALDHAVRSGQGAVRRHLVVLRRRRPRRRRTIARELGTPLLIHQPSYSHAQPLDREGPARRARGAGHGLHRVHARWPRGCSPTATSTACRRTRGPPARAARSPAEHLDEATLRHVRRLNEIAEGRGQKLAQLALQWALRDRRVTSAVIGASSVEQLDTNLDALDGPPLTDDELAAIDQDAVEAGINLWAGSTED